MYQQTKIDETAYFLYVKFPVWVAFRQTKDLNHKIQIYFFPLKSKIKFSIFLLYYFSIFLSFKKQVFQLSKETRVELRDTRVYSMIVKRSVAYYMRILVVLSVLGFHGQQQGKEKVFFSSLLLYLLKSIIIFSL